MPRYRDLPSQTPMSPVPESYAASALGLSKLAVATTRCELDIAYGPKDAHRLDIFLPQEEGSGRPVYIDIHGGYWMNGYKEWMGFGAIPVVAAGAIFVSIEYRLSDVAKYPAQIEDCFAALAWVHANISRYGGDPARLFVGGHSAGGHLAALLALRRDLYPDHGLPRDVVKACFPYCGVYDLRPAPPYGAPADKVPVDALLADVHQAGQASPICWTDGNEVPFFVSWGEKDSSTMLLQSLPFVLALRDAPGRVETHVFPGFDHFYTALDHVRPGNFHNRTLLAWMFGDPGSTPLPPR